jgi:hypothetical protein
MQSCTRDDFTVMLSSAANQAWRGCHCELLKSTLKIKNSKNIHSFVHSFERSGGGHCEAISDVAERVLNFSILYTHICGGVNKFQFCMLGVKIGAKSVPFLPTKSDRIFGQKFTASKTFFFL